MGCNDQISDESDDGFITVPKKKSGVKTTKTSCVSFRGGPSLSSEDDGTSSVVTKGHDTSTSEFL